MVRIILEKPSIITSDQVIELLDDFRAFWKANPSGVGDKITTKTAISTVVTDGATTGTTNLSSATLDAVSDGAAIGDYVTIIKSTVEGNIGCWRITAVTNLTTLVLDANLTNDTTMSFTIDQGRHIRYDLKDINMFILP